MKTPAAPSLLPADLIAMMDKGVSAIVASRDAAMRPSIMRAVGTHIDTQGREITVYVARSQSRQLIQDISSNGCVAVVFSKPSTHRSVQLKAGDARIRPATGADEPILQRYLRSMEQEIALVGHAPALTRAMLAHRLDDVVAITFTPQQAYDQTPGPRAGQSMPVPGSRA